MGRKEFNERLDELNYIRKNLLDTKNDNDRKTIDQVEEEISHHKAFASNLK